MDQLIEKPDDIYANILSNLKKGVKDRRHGFHTPVFSNINEKGLLNSRVVVLRQFDSNKMRISFNSDLRSNKINELKLNTKTNFLFYDQKIKIQLRITTDSKIYYNNDIAEQAWSKSSLSSRKCYLTEDAPGTIKASATDGLPTHLTGIEPTRDESEKGYANFSVVSNQIQSIDWLYLSASGHRRLLIKINGNQNNYKWLIP